MSSDRPNRIIRIETPAFVHIYRVCSHGRSCFTVCKKLNSLEKKFLSYFYQNITLAIKLNARFEFSDLLAISFYSARLRRWSGYLTLCHYYVFHTTRYAFINVILRVHRATMDNAMVSTPARGFLDNYNYIKGGKKTVGKIVCTLIEKRCLESF